MIAPHELPLAVPASPIPTLSTARLTLRAPALNDFPHWAEVFCGPAGPFLGGPFTRDDAFLAFTGAVGLWHVRGFGPWAVDRTADGITLGFVLIGFEPGDLEPELGFLFRPIAEGQGFATEAAAAVRDHAFTVWGLPRLVSYIDPQNTRSAALAQRLGARRQGVHDGCEVWVHRPVAETGRLPRVETEARRLQDAVRGA